MSHDEFLDLLNKDNPFIRYLNEKDQEIFNRYGIDSWVYDGPPPKILELGDSCSHEWKEYLGLNEQFTYCSKCDKKKDV